jgi:hypothetical protein
MILIEGSRAVIATAMISGVREALLIYDLKHIPHT